MTDSIKKHTIMRSQSIFITASLVPILALYCLFLFIPIIASLILSFFNYSGVGSSPFIGLSNYIGLFKDPVFKKALVNTLFFVIITVNANLLIATTMALIIYSVKKKKMKSFLRGWFFMPAIVPIVALCYVWMLMYESNTGVINHLINMLGIHNQYWLSDIKLALPSIMVTELWCDLGYNLVLLMAGLDSIPAMFFEAAKIDGATEWQIVTKITLPLLVRTLLFVSMMTYISYFQVFAQVQIMTNGGPDNASSVLALAIYQNAFQYSRMGYACAMSVVLLIMVLIVSLFQLKTVKADWEY